ncbi:tRNA dimethylallyltransferase [bioreactor metagenome]|uniref:tRNA dimethylallyltransferase n=1 Tax=bioreactor metagenome TaxID=1076179 RepID=A0A644T1B4_9ZZZZ|nr:tRNA (adenosine(37)-N6)-dimethylallyltransferase MiaA [Negativicutes bacterium]
MERLIAIIGPTAVGKTKVSIDLAKRFDTEIVSGDSMLVYKGMDIGTAKPNMAERNGIIHHMIDILDPTQEFSVADFQTIAGKHIIDINQRENIPILAGGTGLYVKALLEGYQFNTPSASTELRSKFESLAGKFGNVYVHNLLEQVDHENALRLHPNDLRRVIRALEVYYVSGSPFQQCKETDNGHLMYDAVVIGLTMNRNQLYQRINQRVELMFEQGLVTEVEQLMQSGVPINAQAMQGIGYKEIISYLGGETDLFTAITRIKQASRHFAKRQLTWYRKMRYIVWFNIDEFSCYDDMMESIYNYIAGKFWIKSK